MNEEKSKENNTFHLFLFLIKKVNIMSYCTTYFVKKNSIPSETEKEKLFFEEK